jgi:hypothetical protein
MICICRVILVMVMTLTFGSQDFTSQDYHREPKEPTVVYYVSPFATILRTEEIDNT